MQLQVNIFFWMRMHFINCKLKTEQNDSLSLLKWVNYFFFGPKWMRKKKWEKKNQQKPSEIRNSIYFEYFQCHRYWQGILDFRFQKHNYRCCHHFGNSEELHFEEVSKRQMSSNVLPKKKKEEKFEFKSIITCFKYVRVLLTPVAKLKSEISFFLSFSTILCHAVDILLRSVFTLML